jgi:hypothetical protein
MPKLFIIPGFIVVSVWIWVAVRTTGALQVISGGTIPFSKREIWLLKILALIVGAGGAMSLTEEFGAPWFLAIVPGGAIVFFSVMEKVAAVVPLKPSQDASTYRIAWQEYHRLRETYMRSLRWFGVIFLVPLAVEVLASIWLHRLPENVQRGFVAIWFTALIVCMAVMGFNQFKWYRWPCPRCGCAFRGFGARPWLPKRCVYCGLEREERNRN